MSVPDDVAIGSATMMSTVLVSNVRLNVPVIKWMLHFLRLVFILISPKWLTGSCCGYKGMIVLIASIRTLLKFSLD